MALRTRDGGRGISERFDDETSEIRGHSTSLASRVLQRMQSILLNKLAANSHSCTTLKAGILPRLACCLVMAAWSLGAWSVVTADSSDAGLGGKETRVAARAEVPLGHLVPGDVFRDCLACPEMVVVSAGTFLMGSSDDETGRLSPQHEVRILRPFAVGRFEVTLREWEACKVDGVCRRTLQRLREGWHRLPIANVRWKQATNYVGWLSRKTGKTYRLLTEAEWEYAARAGTRTRWWCGNRESCLGGVAWYSDNSAGGTHPVSRARPVGMKRANAFGLHDVHGNVWELVEDCWHENYAGAPSDGSAWMSDGNCGRRVLRGGSWGSDPWILRVANRFGYKHRSYSIGFRVARELDQLTVR